MPNKEKTEKLISEGRCPECTRPNDTTSYRCSSCRARRRLKAQQNVAAGLCYDCGKPATDGKKCANCRNNDKAKDKRKRIKLRDEAFNQYGGYRCTCAGCACTTPEFLQLDHINNDGGKHRREIGGKQQIGGNRMLYWLKKNGWPKIVQPMCANCNFAKGHYGNCPLAGKPH